MAFPLGPSITGQSLQSRNPLMEAHAKALLSQYKLTPATLAMRLDPNWIPAPWLLYVAQRIAIALHKGNGRIIISAPPRHGKSRLITVYTSIWIQEIFRRAYIILTSYGADLSKDFGREVRNIIDANQDKLDVRIAADKAQAGAWGNQWGGGMFSVGVGGAITGRGAHVLLIDDYIKEIKEALSETHREYIWNWFTTTAFTRLEPGGSCIIIATRWHHDDLIGRILKSPEAGAWDYIHIPAIAMTDNDVLGRMKGDPLFEQRYPLAALEERRATLGSFYFNALYQQVPENPDAKLADVNWFKPAIDLSSVPNLQKMRKMRVWDFAATADGGDYTTGGLYAYDPAMDTLYLLNMIRVQKSPGGVEKLVENTALADGEDVEIALEQEPGASGKALVYHFKETVLSGYNVIAVPATDGKLARAQPMLAAAESGHVKVLCGTWNQALFAEIETFPAGKKDDQVDNMSIAYNTLSGKRSYSATWGRGNGQGGVPIKRSGLITPETKSLITSTGAVWGRR